MNNMTPYFFKIKNYRKLHRSTAGFVIEYMTSIFVGTLHWWLTADSQMTPDQLAKYWSLN